MPTDRWRRLDQLFNEASAQPAGMRGDFLARLAAPMPHAGRACVAAGAVANPATFSRRRRSTCLRARSPAKGGVFGPAIASASYTIERRLGAGGMGEVWRARDERLGRDVAIKLLLPHPSNAADRVRAFQHEARAAGTLNHTNVLTVYDVGDHGGAPYLVTECLEGESLRARLGAGALSVDAALDVALQVARGLGAAHARGIVHRDLKPENIFLALDGRVKILDFGLATLHDAAPPAPPSQAPSARPRSLVGGTAGYMAPEQVRGEAVRHRADIFALGAVLYRNARRSRQERTSGAGASLTWPRSRPIRSEVHRCAGASRNRGGRFATQSRGGARVIRVELLRRHRVTPAGRACVLALVPSCRGRSRGLECWRVSALAGPARIAAPEAQRLLSRGDYAEAFLLDARGANRRAGRSPPCGSCGSTRRSPGS